MCSPGVWRWGALALWTCTLAGCTNIPAQGSAAGDQAQSAASTRVAFAQALPAMDGRRLEVKLIEVTYPPGGFSAPHRHPCAVVGYVLEGAMRMQVKGRPETIYRVGESFSEGPDDVHQVSANASRTEPARFLAYFTCDHPTPLTVPVP